ncbi:MAG: DUF3919 family protein [Thermotogae bacterium]|nr:DUF3919 family protein [Thermotogota bacterium]
MKKLKLLFFIIIYFSIISFVIYIGLKGIMEWYDRPYFIEKTQDEKEKNIILEEIPYKIVFYYRGESVEIKDSQYIISVWNKIKEIPYYTQTTVEDISNSSIKGKFVFINNEYKNFTVDNDLKIENYYYGKENSDFILKFREQLINYYKMSGFTSK